MLLVIVIDCHLAMLFIECYFICPRTLIFRYSLPADHRIHPGYRPFRHFICHTKCYYATCMSHAGLPRGCLGGSSTYQHAERLQAKTALHDHTRVPDACNDLQWIHIGCGASCGYSRLDVATSPRTHGPLIFDREALCASAQSLQSSIATYLLCTGN